MRMGAVLLALVSLSACNRNNQAQAAADSRGASQAPATLTFAGATTSDDAAMLAHGERLTHVLGCRGCHEENLEGSWFNSDSPEMGKIYASNLTRVLPTMTDAQLETLLRTGKHPTRGDLWIMPAEVFQRMSDADMKAVIAHLRTVAPSGAATPPPAFSPEARAEIAKGAMKPVAAYVAEYRSKLPVDMGPKYAFGRYIAENTCAECHGADLTGIPDFSPGVSTPDLDIAGAYSEADLTQLLTTGKGKTKPYLGLMSRVAKAHFSYFTPEERAAVVAYVKARANRPQ